jgi:rubredoxin
MSTPAPLQWVCTMCSHVYDESVGDPAQGISPGTRLQDLPDDWACPDCGVGREDFEVSP